MQKNYTSKHDHSLKVILVAAFVLASLVYNLMVDLMITFIELWSTALVWITF
jgi:hypothetical protein